MNKMDKLIERLIISATNNSGVSILGKRRSIAGIVQLSSINYRETLGVYYKVFLKDHSALIIIPKENQLQFSEDGDLGRIPGISDEMVGKNKYVTYLNQRYQLENPNDYQYTTHLLYGDFEAVEGECRFSDYVNTTNSDEFLSLGWLSVSNDRADVHSRTINLSDIVIN